MLPTLSRLSVSYSPVSRLRHWCSSQSLRISPLHWEFHLPLLHSSPTVSKAIPTLKAGLSLQTYRAAYAPFTPNHSGQRSPVMDARNQSIPFDAVRSTDVNKAIQRSLTKACARHGLGLYIYAGEDLPESTEKAPQPRSYHPKTSFQFQ